MNNQLTDEQKAEIHEMRARAKADPTFTSTKEFLVWIIQLERAGLIPAFMIYVSELQEQDKCKLTSEAEPRS